MRCDHIRVRLDILWEGELPVECSEHLTECTACSRYFRDLRLVRSGFHLMKREDPPEPSLGFSERLIRQLGEISKAPSVVDIFERVGRRFVYATLVLTILALLGLALPPTGPVRGLAAADLQVRGQEASLAYSDLIGETGGLGSPDAAPVEAPAPSVANEEK